MREEAWQNDLYGQLANAGASQVNPLAAGLLETLDDPRFRALRDGFLDDLRLYPGAATLEVGCGPAMLLEAIHERTGPDGPIVGLDLNPHFISVARQRVEMLGIANARYIAADCQKLPFEDGTFDAVVAEKLLMHVAPIRRAITEMARVLSIGGRIVLVDYDPYSAFAAGPNPTITARILASAATIYASPQAARETARACVDVGLYVEKVRGHLLVFEDPHARTAGGIAPVWADHAIMGRQVDPSTVQRWLKAVDRAVEQRRFLVAIPHIITVATRVS